MYGGLFEWLEAGDFVESLGTACGGERRDLQCHSEIDTKIIQPMTLAAMSSGAIHAFAPVGGSGRVVTEAGRSGDDVTATCWIGSAGKVNHEGHAARATGPVQKDRPKRRGPTSRAQLREPNSATLTPMEHSAKFFVGQIVHHKKFNYRGVVFDVDATFQGTDEWYDAVARSRPAKDLPWYHVLVEGVEHTTYVAERHLESDESAEPIQHPLVAELCGEYQEGRYSMRIRVQ